MLHILTVALALIARFDSGDVLVPQHHAYSGLSTELVRVPEAPAGTHAVAHMTATVRFAFFAENWASTPVSSYQWGSGWLFSTGNQVCSNVCAGGLGASNGVYDPPSCQYPVYCEGFEPGSDHHVVVGCIELPLTPLPACDRSISVHTYFQGITDWAGQVAYMHPEPSWGAWPLYTTMRVRGYFTFEPD